MDPAGSFVSVFWVMVLIGNISYLFGYCEQCVKLWQGNMFYDLNFAVLGNAACIFSKDTS